MQGSIKRRLLQGFFCIVGVFGVGGLVIMVMIQGASHETRQFLAEYWPTADLIMETRIAYDEMSRKILLPQDGVAVPELVETAQDTMSRFRERFRATNLSPQDQQRIDSLLEQVYLAIPRPVELAREPGLRMEEADALAGPVFDILRRQGEIDALNALWEVVMAFNDFLITGEPREREHFASEAAALEAHPRFSSIEVPYRVFKAKAQEVFAAAEQLAAARKTFLQSGSDLSAALSELEHRYEATVVTPASAAILGHLSSSLILLWGTAIVSALLSAFIAMRTALGISGPVRQVVEVLKRMEQGQLNHSLRLQRDDEIGQMAKALDDMGTNLHRMVVRVDRSGRELQEVSLEVTEVAQTVAGAANSQAGSVHQVAGAVQKILASSQSAVKSVERLQADAEDSTSHLGQISLQIEDTAKHAQRLGDAAAEVGKAIGTMTTSIAEVAGRAEDLSQASKNTAASIAQMEATNRDVEQRAKGTLDIAQEVNRDARIGRQSVEETIRGIESIRSAANEVVDVVSLLAEKTDNINQVLSVIGAISDQIDLLALNAAIIAAQSGEHGRGFAVVAEEIKELSRQTSLSTREIGRVIQAVQEGTTRAVKAIRHAESSIAEGEALSQRSGRCLDKIVTGVEEATGQMQGIADFTQAQAQESRQIRDTMARVEAMVNQIATLTRAQERDSASIAAATRLMSDLSSLVREATGEQSHSAHAVAGSAREIQGRVQAILQACDEQRLECENIAQALAGVEGGARENLAQAGKLQRSVARLTQQVDSLQNEMEMFSLNGEDSDKGRQTV